MYFNIRMLNTIIKVMERCNMDVRKTLGANINKRRLLKNVSREKFAEIINISDVHLGRIERGEVYSSLRTIEVIAKQLNTNVYELFTPADIKDTVPTDIRTLRNSILQKIKSKNDKDISQLILLNNLLDYL